MKCYAIFSFQLFIVAIQCTDNEETKSKNPLPYFKRDIEKDLHKPNSASDDAQDIASFLIDNVKEILNDNDDIREFPISPMLLRSVTNTQANNSINSNEEAPKLTDDFKVYQNITLSTIVDPYELVSPGYEVGNAKHTHMILLSENSVRKSEQKIVRNHTYILVSSLAPDSKTVHKRTSKRSCIFCDNVANDDCSDPKNKLISSIICERDEDQCFSMHTPFGIIVRGCFNADRNLTTYVCACNLCNHISVTEMPYVFSNKREWVHNVAELSRIRNLRSSVFKDMACLRCEVNMTVSKQYSVLDDNCVNGNIGNLPTEICNPNEICAVKMVKSEGYVWRGCIRSPLYNYWLNLCDRDLCNYDSSISMYDYI